MLKWDTLPLETPFPSFLLASVVASSLCHYLVPRGFPSVLWLHLDFPLEKTVSDFYVDSTTLVRYHCSDSPEIALAKE
jgi:hypothetical protein